MTKKVVTHNGKFHADDVFGVATLQLLFGVDGLEILRTRDEEEVQNADIVLDVGMEHNAEEDRFDHHQPGGAGQRKNGIEYASFGLIWKKYGLEIVGGSREVWEAVDARLVQQIDAGDNGIETFQSLIDGVSPYTVGGVISSFRPTWKEETDYREEFFSAVTFARELLEREIKNAQDFIEAKERVVSVYERSKNKELIIFEKTDAFGREITVSVLSEFKEPLFAVLFRPDVGSWQLVCVPKERGSFECRKSLPEGWYGKRNEEFDAVTKIEGGEFCHRAGFMAVTKTKEGALALAHKALEHNEKQ